ncbi:tRNA pseudouridine38-40 synthase [Sporobacter termitidis DSM 10068]|uniref:tRNA pseudouridine synthase A n=1 Tax=Sporobacter termitidis DSM 10068 TaxID=1123282 RepID=A0A1M5ZEW5_9FIRM|nr:tRNA pseudouridine(38-40) synthase TruA [Sporobacter termitidis]SHI22780.1 tRNA pseudouridine38-40 synthase [Sporobacter termitidis DSM 10068]
MRNIALRLRYDGTRYHGWQEQKNDVTVAATLQKALTRVCGHPVKAVGCGRTDAGVHAERYCANFKTDARIPADRLPLALNALLPPDIAVTDAVDADEDFNAILSCLKKEYTYKIYNSRIRDPFYADRAYFYPAPLNAELMARAARHFVGTRDFAAVRSVGTETKTTVRTVYWYEVTQSGRMLELRVCADGFLYNMARAMAGTLLYVSEGKIGPDELPGLLEARDRRLTGPTVPPCGLYMTRIWYDGPVGRMMSAD